MSTKTVLVVDDDPGTREMLYAVLWKAGFKVHVAENGEQAKALCLQFRPDTILLDLHMPVLTGYGFLDWLDEEVDPRPRVVILTADKSPESRKKVEERTESYLTKPFNLVELSDLL